MTYDRQAAQTLALRQDNAALRQAAIEAGLPFYKVPLCGGGFAGHRKSVRNGRCLDCRATTSAAKQKVHQEEAHLRKLAKQTPMPGSQEAEDLAVARTNAPLRQAAIDAGMTYFITPQCGGGYAGHRKSVFSNRCLDCKKVHKASLLAAGQ